MDWYRENCCEHPNIQFTKLRKLRKLKGQNCVDPAKMLNTIRLTNIVLRSYDNNRDDDRNNGVLKTRANDVDMCT